MKPMGKAFFLPTILIPFGMRLFYEIWHDAVAADNPLASMGGSIVNPIAIIGLIVYLLFVFKLWDAIQDGKTRPSATLAAGLLLVPLWNIFWRFKALLGWTTEYKKYAERNRLQVPEIPRWSFLIYCVIGLATGIMEYFDWYGGPDRFHTHSHVLRAINLVMLGIVITHGCNAVNALVEQDLPESPKKKLTQKQLVMIGIVAGIVLMVGTVVVTESQLLKPSTAKQHTEMVVDAMQAIRTALKLYREENEQYPQTMSDLTGNGYLTLDPKVSREWEFLLIGNPPTKIHALSTSAMPGGKGNSILYDIEQESYTGYGQK